MAKKINIAYWKQHAIKKGKMTPEESTTIKPKDAPLSDPRREEYFFFLRKERLKDWFFAGGWKFLCFLSFGCIVFTIVFGSAEKATKQFNGADDHSIERIKDENEQDFHHMDSNYRSRKLEWGENLINSEEK